MLEDYLTFRFQAWYNWCVETFGARSTTMPSERALRVMEEAVELIQSEGVSKKTAHDVINRCYNRPVGDPNQEVGQIFFTLGVYCLLKNIDPVAEADKDFLRVLEILKDDPDYFKRRVEAKRLAGIELSEEPVT